MSAITGVSYSYSGKPKEIGESGYRTFYTQISFGDGTLTYPSGGIPLDFGKLGCPVDMRDISILPDSSGVDGYVYKVDLVNKKLMIFEVPAASDLTSAAPLTELANTVAPAATVLKVVAHGW
jgi:hypothetical protein